MTELVMCRRGPERQTGAARPDLVNVAMLPSAQPFKHLCSRRSRSRPRARATWKDFQRRYLPGWPSLGEVTLFARQR